MTVQESTICSLIQTFPVLLILAQNHNRCLKTPLIYKPPTPTQSPEYYQALDALIHNLYGHGGHHDSGYHDHDPGYLCYGYNGKGYGHTHSHTGYGSPCYNYGYGGGHSLGHGHGLGSSHGVGSSHGLGFSYGLGSSHGFGHGYPHGFTHGQQYPVYGFKKVNVYNLTNGYGVKAYAPNQVYTLNKKYKVVVKRNKIPGRRKFQKLTAADGVYENQPRQDRRYTSYDGFSQNFVPRQDRYRNQVSGTLHVRPENQNSNPAYVYPFDTRRSVSNTGYYDQYGRYQPTQNNYGRQNYPEWQNYQDYGRPNYQPNQNYYGEYNNNNNNNGKPVRFPTDNQVSNSNDPIIIVIEESDEGTKPASIAENSISGQDTNGVNNVAEDKGVNFPPTGDKKNDYVGFPNAPPSTEAATLPPLMPVPPSEVHTEAPPFPPFPNDPAPAFTSPPANQGFPAYQPASNTDKTTELAPLQPVENSNPNDGFSSFKPEAPGSELTPLRPVENSNANNGFSPFKPESPGSELTPLQPVENSNPNNGFSQFNPDYTNPNGFPTFKPKSPEPELKPLQPVEDSNANNGFTSFKPQDLFPLPGDQATLPPLTPVPPSELRNNFNFGPAAGPFQAPCQTVEGGVGSCVSVFECQPYLTMLQRSRSDPAVIQLLRRAHCGFDGNNPKVCCPRPGIPTAPPEFPTAPPITTTTTTSTTTTTTPRPTSKPKAACPPETYLVGAEDRVPILPEPPVCGVSNASMSRVVGGVNASLGDFPFMALLGYRNARRSTSWLCGGSIVTSKHVLTAAHCIKCREDRLYVVRVGELDLSRDDEGATPVDVLIKAHIIHQGYDANSFTNDIGLLVLRQELQFTPLIRPICLPQSAELRSRTYERYTPIIAGWGDLHFRGPQSQQLQALQLPVVSNDLCRQKYIKYKSQVIDERVLCAGYRMGGRDACQGDSGGPLMLPVHRPDIRSTENTYFYQIGVVSFGYKCAEPNFPGVYTRVTHFIPWLEQQLLPVR